MANTIVIQDTITQVNTLIVEMPSDKLLQERYFPTGEMDIFDSKKVMVDFDNGNRMAGVFLKRGYDKQDTTTFFTQTVEPPRIGVVDSIDEINNDKDRMMFERLSRPQGDIRPTRADAMNGLLRLKAVRCADRVSRSIERFCADVFRQNGINISYKEAPGNNNTVTSQLFFYEGNTNPQAVSAHAKWGTNGATPYKDVCAALKELRAHGGRAEEVLMSPDAWDYLRADMISLGLWNPAQIHMTLIANEKGRDNLFPEIMDYVEVIGDALFDGYRLKLLVYSGGCDVIPDDPDDPIEWESYLGELFVCITAPKCGRTLCGSVSKVNPRAIVDQEIDAVSCLTGKYIATRRVQLDNDAGEDEGVQIRVESVPLPIPNRVWSWVTIDMGE
jgi:hypothetical protein